MTWAVLLGFAAAQDQVQPKTGQAIRLSAPVGARASYSLRIAFEAEGQTMAYTATLTRTLVEAGVHGWTFKEEEAGPKLVQEKAEMAFPNPPAKTIVFDPQGAPIQVKGARTDPTDDAFQRLIACCLPSGKVKVGQSWEAVLPPVPERGLAEARASASFARMEKVQGADCMVVECRVSEQGPEPRASAESSFWLDVKTGLPVKASCRMENAPLAGRRVRAVWSISRIVPSGGVKKGK